MLDNLSEIDEEDTFKSHIGHKSLIHREIKSNLDDNDLKKHKHTSKCNNTVQLNLKIPKRVINEVVHMQRKLKVKKLKVIP